MPIDDVSGSFKRELGVWGKKTKDVKERDMHIEFKSCKFMFL